MQPEARRAAVALTTLVVLAPLLLRLAWLPGVGLTRLPYALVTVSPDRSLPLVLTLGLCCVTLWLTTTVLVALAARGPGTSGRWAKAALRRLAPATVRRTLELTLGLTVLAGTTGVAQAAGPAGHVTVSQPVTVGTSVGSPLLSLDWPAAPAAAPVPALTLDRPTPPLVHHDPGRGLSLVTSVPRKVPAAQPIPAQTVTVRPGDSLWRIAARALPRGATTAAVERSWHRWYGANRAVIGPDPGLLQPGQQLTPPSS